MSDTEDWDAVAAPAAEVPTGEQALRHIGVQQDPDGELAAATVAMRQRPITITVEEIDEIVERAVDIAVANVASRESSKNAEVRESARKAGGRRSSFKRALKDLAIGVAGSGAFEFLVWLANHETFWMGADEMSADARERERQRKLVVETLAEPLDRDQRQRLERLVEGYRVAAAYEDAALHRLQTDERSSEFAAVLMSGFGFDSTEVSDILLRGIVRDLLFELKETGRAKVLAQVERW